MMDPKKKNVRPHLSLFGFCDLHLKTDHIIHQKIPVHRYPESLMESKKSHHHAYLYKRVSAKEKTSEIPLIVLEPIRRYFRRIFSEKEIPEQCDSSVNNGSLLRRSGDIRQILSERTQSHRKSKSTFLPLRFVGV